MPRTRGAKSKYGRGKNGLKKALDLLQEIRDNMEEGASFEEFDPTALEAVGTILSVMRGKLTGRYVGFRLAAATTILERYRGKPLAKTQQDIGDNLRALLERSLDRQEQLSPEERAKFVGSGSSREHAPALPSSSLDSEVDTALAVHAEVMK
jgi:hypothetical protein